ncbi:MAG: hypothetical protein BGO47_11440 [Microbacterium sp. 67-17]|uniref:COG1470 family protein n=1 Tax=Microbacterium sp. 67-17 TaxID=1895782 RepID=UPI00095F0DA1|nr:DUF916 domain-containing protein [Microbacterium sp. 67-17]OJW02331.1 MAG: hypothetical protein BGO47_11440 [Microbacterium sp. 67-17]
MAISPELSRARSLVRTLAATLAVVAAVGILTPAGAARAEDTIGISARPAAADGTADTRTRFSYKVDPGQRVDDNFLVANTGSTPQNFTVIATDAFNDGEGDFALLGTEEASTSVGQWVKFENGTNRIEFSLEPGQSRLLPFTVELPADATPGDHAGGLVASVVTPGEQVNLDRRVGTRLYARVSGQLQPLLSISALNSEYLGDWWNPFSGTVRMYYTVTNTGNVALATNTSFGVDTWFGLQAAASNGDAIAELLPGGGRSVTVDVPGVPAWLYLAPWVELTPFVDSPQAENALTVDGSSRSGILIAVPWALVILAAIGVGIGLLLRWRRRRDEERAEEWLRYTEREVKRQAAEEARAGAGAASGGRGAE